MKELGAILKAAREKKGVSLEDIQMITKIRLKHLEALEAGDFAQLPGEVYVKGFLANFAKTVGLDGDEILKKYYELKNRETMVDSEADEEQLIFSTPCSPVTLSQEKSASLEGKGSKLKKSPLLLVGIVFTFLIITGGVLLFYFKGRSSSLPVEPEPVATHEEVDVVQEPVPAFEEPVAEPEPVKPLLRAEAREVVWIGVYRKASGKMIFEGTLHPREKQEWLLTEDVALRIGNAGGLKLTYKGKDLGELGYSGQVINKVISLEE